MKRDQYADSRTRPQEEEEDEDYIFPESDSRLLTEEDFEGKTKAELRLGRNEIFARHGESSKPKILTNGSHPNTGMNRSTQRMNFPGMYG